MTGAEDWYVGTVIRRVSGRTKHPVKVLYEIHYEDGDTTEINSAEDFLNGELHLLDDPCESALNSVLPVPLNLDQ